MTTETERAAQVTAMRARSVPPSAQDVMAAICVNCHNTYGEHKGPYCVKGPKQFRTIAATRFEAPQP